MLNDLQRVASTFLDYVSDPPSADTADAPLHPLLYILAGIAVAALLVGLSTLLTLALDAVIHADLTPEAYWW